jgi:hypothetical protein
MTHGLSYVCRHGHASYCPECEAGQEADRDAWKALAVELGEALQRGGAPRDGEWHRFTCMANPCSYVCEAQREALRRLQERQEAS